ncbi:hypothetical protein [Variovorax sp. LG9.2]|uniref:hypothetical protein n=1 Tax=Variovorax sp. LG9.2 TaxID=3048626 RepID=UPI002B23BFC4|nr:hypothetical protein [Variovorax sp. LG9.2]MEB0057322.1 hypothetical protein [Variovorax sp. LG9.2]
MQAFFKTLFSDGSNTDCDFSKVFGAIGIAMFFAVSIYAYGYKGTAFSPIEWATGFTAILAGAAGVSKLRDRTAPPPEVK